jgi:hypothetical protein
MILSNDIDYIHDMHNAARERLELANEYLNDALDALHAGKVLSVLTALRFAAIDVGWNSCAPITSMRCNVAAHQVILQSVTLLSLCSLWVYAGK